MVTAPQRFQHPARSSLRSSLVSYPLYFERLNRAIDWLPQLDIYVDLCGCKEGTKKYTTTTTIVYPHCGCTDMKPPKVPVTTTTAVYELSGAPATATLTLPIKGPDAPTNENGGGAAAAATGGGPGGNPAGGAGGPTRWSSPGSTSTTTPMQVMKGVSMRVSVSGVWAGVGFMMSAYLLL